MKLFQIALDQARKAGNVAGEGMAWGNLGTAYRALEQFEDAIACHLKYRDNAERRLDIGGLAIMQHQLAMDYFLSGNLPEAEGSILSAFQTLEKIRSQLGEEDKSKLSNFEKNQAEAYDLLQVVLVAQCKYKEAFVLADASRGRALSEIVQRRLCGSTSSERGASCINEEFITESFQNLLDVSLKLSTTLVLYSVVKEFDQTGAVFSWVYTWVLQPTGNLHFSKTRLQDGIETKVELNDEFVVSLRRSMGLQFQSDDLSKILRSERLLNGPNEKKAQLATPANEEVLESLKGLEDTFATGLRSDSLSHKMGVSHYSPWSIPFNSKEKGIHERPTLKLDFDTEDEEHKQKHFSVTSELKQKTSHSSMAEAIALTEYPLEPINVISDGIPPGAIDVDILDSADRNLKETVSSESFIASMQSAIHTEIDAAIQHHLAPSNAVSKHNMAGYFTNDAVPDPSGPTSNGTGMSTSSMESETELEEDIQDPLPLNKNVSEHIDSSGANSNEAVSTDVCSSNVELEKDRHDHLAPSNDVSNDTTPGPKRDVVTNPSSANSKEATSSEVPTIPIESQNDVKIMIEQDKLDTVKSNGDLSKSSSNDQGTCNDGKSGPIKDAVTISSVPHLKKTVRIEVCTVSLQSFDITEMVEDFQDSLSLNNGFSEQSRPCPMNDVPTDTSGTLLLETVSIEAATNRIQSGCPTKMQGGIQDPLATHNDASASTISAANSTIVTDTSSIHSKETVIMEPLTTAVKSAQQIELEYTQDPSPPDNDISGETLMNGAVTDHSISIPKVTQSSESSTNAIFIEEKEDKLDHFALDYDLSGSSTNGQINDDTFVPSDRHVDPELAPWRPMLNQLHKILIEPIADFLPRSDANPRITFIPQDFLLKVPFAALHGSTEHRYVIEDFVISTSPAIHFLELACTSRDSSQKKISLLAVGNPIMPFAELPQLPSAQHEVRMISEIVNSGDSELFIGAQAKKKDVVAAMPRHKILHFATHAIIDDSDSHGDFSMKGLVVLAKSGNDCNGLLTAEEVRSMELNAELVVLSCCDTGLGKVTGDGVLGELGPLQMSPVDRSGSVSEISPRHSFLYKISMCAYEKAGWPGYRNLGNRAGNFFPYEHSSPDTGIVRDETVATLHGL